MQIRPQAHRERKPRCHRSASPFASRQRDRPSGHAR